LVIEVRALLLIHHRLRLHFLLRFSFRQAAQRRLHVRLVRRRRQSIMRMDDMIDAAAASRQQPVRSTARGAVPAPL